MKQERGFSLIELMLVAGMAAVLMAIAIPSISVGNRVRVNNAASEVRQVLQSARLRAVAVNRPLQLRLNCPVAGEYRVVEAGWPEAGRCSPTNYPYPAPQNAAYQEPPKPRHDGPVQRVNNKVTLNPAEPSLVLQFSPDGRTMKVVSGAAQAIASVPITVSANGYQKTININGLGKIIAQ